MATEAVQNSSPKQGANTAPLTAGGNVSNTAQTPVSPQAPLMQNFNDKADRLFDILKEHRADKILQVRQKLHHVQDGLGLQKSDSINKETTSKILEHLHSKGVSIEDSDAKDEHSIFLAYNKALQDHLPVLFDNAKETLASPLRQKRNQKAEDSLVATGFSQENAKNIAAQLGNTDTQSALTKSLRSTAKDAGLEIDANKVSDSLWSLKAKYDQDIKAKMKTLRQSSSLQDFQLLCLIHDYFQGTRDGTPTHSFQSFINPVEERELENDNFFKKDFPDIYQILRTKGSLSASDLPTSFSSYNPQNPENRSPTLFVYHQAEVRMHAQMKDLGIKDQELTQAIIEGRYAPSLADLEMAYNAAFPSVQDIVGDPQLSGILEDEMNNGFFRLHGFYEIVSPEDTTHKMQALKDAIKNGSYDQLVAQGNNSDLARFARGVKAAMEGFKKTSPDNDCLIGGMIDIYRSKAWNTKYGDLAKLQMTQSYERHIQNDKISGGAVDANIKEARPSLNGKMMALNMVIRLTGDRFEGLFGLEPDNAKSLLHDNPDMTLTDLDVSTNQKLGTHLQTYLDSGELNVVSYFAKGQYDSAPNQYSFANHYNGLREQVYLQKNLDVDPTVSVTPTSTPSPSATLGAGAP